MNFIHQIEQFLLVWAGKVPLEIFAFIGSIIEEIVAPIPSPLVMATAGSIASAQNKGVFFLFWIAAIAATGKTIGCWFFYFFADKAEDLLSSRFGKLIGFSHQEIESIGKHFNGTKKDDFILIFLRALPIMPSTPISIACGFIKMDLVSFLRATYIGSFIRSLIMLYIGYSGLALFKSLIEGMNSLESLMNFVIAGIFVVILGFVYWKRGKVDFLKFLKHKKD